MSSSRKPKIVVVRRDPRSKRCVRIHNPLVEELLLRGIPVTKESYLKFAFPGEELTEPLDAEVRAEVEEALEEAGAHTLPKDAILDRLAKVKASTPPVQAFRKCRSATLKSTVRFPRASQSRTSYRRERPRWVQSST